MNFDNSSWKLENLEPVRSVTEVGRGTFTHQKAGYHTKIRKNYKYVFFPLSI
jgi:hypothetical protein